MTNTIRTSFAAAVLALLMIGLMAGKAQASTAVPGFEKFNITTTDTQAGGHPDVTVEALVRQDQTLLGGYTPGCAPCLDTRRLGIHWPAGFIGNPHATPKCTMTELNVSSCPADAQVGTVDLGQIAGPGTGILIPIYNMETNPNQPGLLGFVTPFIVFPAFFEFSGRTNSDYGLDAVTSAGPRLPFQHFFLNLWGVPPSEKHDPYRFFTPLTGGGACLYGTFGPGIIGCPPSIPYYSPTYASSTIPEVPFLQNPTTCNVPLNATATVEYYGGIRGEATAAYAPTTGCQQGSFDPSFVAKPTTSQTETASGLDTDLRVPQTQSPITPSPSEMAGTKIVFPPGFTINPNAADGKTACAPSATAIGTLFGATCPESSKIGNLMLDVAALPAPIPGALYLLDPQPGDRYRVLIAADGFATHVKLPGSVHPDPQTGQLTLEFNDLPQAPLEEFNVHVFGSERGLFATPPRCGTYPVKTEFFPWNNTLTVRKSESFMTFDSGPGGSACTPEGQLRQFDPTIDAGTETSAAGKHSPFRLVLSRGDGSQYLVGIDVAMPPGLTATLKGVAYCPEAAIERLADSSYSGLAEQASPSCPQASQIGTAIGGAGAGTHPIYVDGKVYLAGPYKGAPLSLVAVLPAVSGPYDLGAVAVRAAIKVDPSTAQVTTVSDPVPLVKEGIPLRTRYVRVNLDRPDFALNPTNCEALEVKTTTTGNEGSRDTATSHFQATNCADLAYEPKLSLRLSGGVKRRGHPVVHTELRPEPGEASTRGITVTLPPEVLIDNAHFDTICTRVSYAANSCPAGSQVGRAKVVTPLLDEPLSGPVYLRSSSHELPDMVFDLGGQFDIDVVVRIDSVKGRLRATVESLPDAPITEATLDLLGGDKGLIQNSKTLCGKSKAFTSRLVGQNGAVVKATPRLQVQCGSKARSKRGKRAAR